MKRFRLVVPKLFQFHKLIHSAPAPPYKKHSSEQLFAQPTKGDNNNKTRYRI
jgi:hypothetical protein